MFNLFKENKYMNCKFLNHSIHFFHDNIRACCSGDIGPIFYDTDDLDNLDKIDYDKIFQIRNKYVENINAGKYKNGVPDCCEKCFEIPTITQNKKIPKLENYINKVYIQNYMTCNAKCYYCNFRDIDRGYKYKVFPLVKDMIERKILKKASHIYLSGGEITMSPEFEDLLSLFISYITEKIEIFTSGIIYSKVIEEALKKDLCILLISLDSGSKETYLKIKNVDCFDRVINNLKTYIKNTENAKENIILKYIICDNINDNIEEINKFFDIVLSLGIKKVRIDIDCNKYYFASNNKFPLYFFDLIKHFKNMAKENNLEEIESDQTNEILKKNKKR